ncbi:DMT family transporter [Tabrizicola sp.]|uniref:DMT family transporter n=1 Tax=Tabrizicola sp. TaxID=2005166 RepID=UPI003F35C623
MRGTDWIMLWTLSLLWGGSFLFVELALAGLPPLTIVWGRVALAAVILWGVMRITGSVVPPRRVWPALLVMGCLNNAVPFTLFVLAQGQITGALASVLNATTPLFTVLVAHIATADERLTAVKAAGVGLGFGGVLAMMAGERLDGAVLAMAACLGAAVSYAVASVWGRRFRQAGLAPLATACGQVTASTLLITPLWLWVDQPWRIAVPGAGPVLAVVGLAALSTALAYLLYFRILASAGSTAISLVTFLIPLSAAAMGWAALGERLELRHLVGLALILAGLALIKWRRAAAA